MHSIEYLFKCNFTYRNLGEEQMILDLGIVDETLNFES